MENRENKEDVAETVIIEETPPSHTQPYGPTPVQQGTQPAAEKPKKRDKMLISAFVLGIVGTSLAAIALILSVVSLGSLSHLSPHFDRVAFTEEFSRDGNESGGTGSTFDRQFPRDSRQLDDQFLEERNELRREYLEDSSGRTHRGPGHGFHSPGTRTQDAQSS